MGEGSGPWRGLAMAIFVGRETADVLRGTRADDDIAGLGGNDALQGGLGRDQIDGGEGDDRLQGGPDNDLLLGGLGDDRLAGDSHDDLLYGGIGEDALEGGDGSDMLSGGSGNDTLSGGSGFDQLNGGDGDDLLAGGPDGDQLVGGDGDDIMRVGIGSDMLESRRDDADQFVFSAEEGNFGYVTITGFNGAGENGGDVVRLEGFQESDFVITEHEGREGPIIYGAPDPAGNEPVSGILPAEPESAGEGWTEFVSDFGTIRVDAIGLTTDDYLFG